MPAIVTKTTTLTFRIDPRKAKRFKEKVRASEQRTASQKLQLMVDEYLATPLAAK